MRNGFIAAATMALSLAGAANAQPSQIPGLATLSAPGQDTATIAGGGALFQATLEDPFTDENGRLLGVNLELHPVGSPDSRSLLEPPGGWHLLQPFMFRVEDCAAPLGGQFGRTRV